MPNRRAGTKVGFLARQAAAFAIVWLVLFALTGTFDLLFDTIVRLAVASWLCIGLGVMLSKRVAFPLPRGDRLDVGGALATLWWAAFWPKYVGRGDRR
ncbi:MAG: hypothetical protein HYX47_12575 [Burkholderiales bacterium]|nr:hypothetical protein [Burkholderiales bacterium]